MTNKLIVATILAEGEFGDTVTLQELEEKGEGEGGKIIINAIEGDENNAYSIKDIELLSKRHLKEIRIYGNE